MDKEQYQLIYSRLDGRTDIFISQQVNTSLESPPKTELKPRHGVHPENKNQELHSRNIQDTMMISERFGYSGGNIRNVRIVSVIRRH